ncbi:hypothetical protein B0H15DRAFT_922830 [Mycena belliarum]|uniref:GST N-terminal domain-containing protein n=1 Tax=Mycena belliarum TaxID=1033014 RepID=A0AAD6U5X7_9AGAR|nr:hypothetical protein B0H15DRAFT_922830 [Mycena belliae]
MSPPIVFYDIPSTLPNKSWSPNTLKTKYALNFKNIPFKIVWVEYPDIERVSKEIGAPPTSNKPDGRPHYTLPMIHDPSTGAVISDSSNIAAYLDATYPDTPRLLPEGTFGLFRAFEAAASALLTPVYPWALPASHSFLNPPSQDYFRSTREKSLGKTLEALVPTGEEGAAAWANFKAGFGKMDEWVRASGTGATYFMDKTPSYADIWIAGYVLWLKLVLPDKWEDMKTWHDGRWATLLRNMEKYEGVPE